MGEKEKKASTPNSKIQKYLSNFVDEIKQHISLGGKGGGLIGIDIGHSAIKVAQLHGSEEGKGHHLKKYASVSLSEGAIIEREVHKRDEIVEAIKEAISKADITGTEVCIGLSGENSITKKLQTAGGTIEEIEDQVVWESEHYLPFPVESAQIDIAILGENQGGGVDVIVAAAKNSLIEQFKSIVEDAGLKVKVIDLDILAVSNVVNLVVMDQFKNSDASVMILDIGAQKTNSIIYRKGILVYTKELNIGGNLITEEIQRCMGVNYQEAEDLKISSINSGGVPEEVETIIEEVSERIGEEISKIVTFYHQSISEESIANCIVTGGSSLVEKLIKKLKDLIKTEVVPLNPFNKITFDKKHIVEDDIEEITTKGVCAMGLAMRKTI